MDVKVTLLLPMFGGREVAWLEEAGEEGNGVEWGLQES